MQLHASIIFTILAVRLIGGSHNEGRVEVYYNDTWGRICDDDWDIRDAQVVCRQLGFHYALDAYESDYRRRCSRYPSARYGQGTGPSLLNTVSCLGSESSLFSCSHRGVGNYNCLYNEDASVRCGISKGENN